MREEFDARATCSEDCAEVSNAASMISSLKPISCRYNAPSGREKNRIF
jgi:hypothetical protein